jgi:hypothetical protein
VVVVVGFLGIFFAGRTFCDGFFATDRVGGLVVSTVPTTPPATSVVVGFDPSRPAPACWLVHAASRTASAVSASAMHRLRRKSFIGVDLGSESGHLRVAATLFCRGRAAENGPVRAYWGTAEALARSESTAMAALRPFMAITLPPGCVDALHR